MDPAGLWKDRRERTSGAVPVTAQASPEAPRRDAEARWTVRDRLVAAFALVFVGAQLLVATIALGAPRPAPFGWQMYSAVPAAHRFVVVEASGVERTVDPTAVLGKVRGEIDLVARLPEVLCASPPPPRRVVVLDERGERRRELRCR